MRAPITPSRGVAASSALALAAVLLVGLNLRGPIAAVAPVIDEVTTELALTPATAGLLTTLPVLCFAAAAPLAGRFGRAVGPVPAIAWAMVLLALALVGRVLGGPLVLLVGTVVVGMALTVGNVLLPVVVKRDFPRRVTGVMALYTATLAGGAALTAGLTAPVALGWGWRTGLGAWSLLALLSLGLWVAAYLRRGRTGPQGSGSAPPAAVPGDPSGIDPSVVDPSAGGPATVDPSAVDPSASAPSAGATSADGRSIWRQPTAWAVGLLLGFQSVLYYALTQWLPLILQDEAALGRTTAGNALSVFQLVGIFATLIVPALARRRPTQSWLGIVLGASWLVMVVGILVAPQWWFVWCVVGGAAQGMGISLAFVLVVLRAPDAESVRALSAMSQLVGYTVGATGPVALGALRSATDGWTGPLLLLVGMALLLTVSGVLAGRDRTVVSALRPARP